MTHGYLCKQLIQERFLNLRDIDPAKKSGLECTTAVLIFLSFDAFLAKTKLEEPISFDAADSDGKKSRDLLSSLFAQFATVGYGEGNIPIQVKRFGTVCVEKSSPEKRLGSNFLTTRLKIAAEKNESCCYPVRPAPLLCVGNVTGVKWGVSRHPEWHINFPILLHGRVSRTPILDLAIFLLRDKQLNIAEDFGETLSAGLTQTYTPDLVAMFSKRIRFEIKKFNPKECYQSDVPSAFKGGDWLDGNKHDNSKSSVVLNNRIKQLETLLALNGIQVPK